MGLSALLSLLRLKFSIPSLVSALVAFTMAHYHYGVSFTLNFLLALLVVFLVTSAGLVINEYYDYELDVFSGRDDLPLVRGEVDRRTARRVYLLLFALALTLSALISTAALATTAIASAFAVAYSRPPLRFKARPLLDSLTNGLTYGPITMALVFESLKLPVVWAVVYSIPSSSSSPPATCSWQFRRLTRTSRLTSEPRPRSLERSGRFSLEQYSLLLPPYSRWVTR